MAYMRGAALAASLLLLAACGGPTGATPTPFSSAGTPTSVASAGFPSPTPGGPTAPPPLAIQPCTSTIPAGHQLALVTLRNILGVIVRDITDLAHPVTRCIFKGAASYFRFVDLTHISYIVTAENGDGALYLVDLNASTTSLVRAWTNEGSLYWVYAWSPDGSMLSYLSSNGDKVAWHVISAAGDVMLSDLGSVPGRGVSPNNDDAMIGFSADGKYVALEQTFTYPGVRAAEGQVPPFQVVSLSDHKLVYSQTSGTMATWATFETPARLYFRDSSGVEAWEPGTGPTNVVSGLAWINPSFSADGRRIAYSTVDPKGNHLANYMRLADRPVTRIKLSAQPRVGVAFLNPTLVWYAGEHACGPTVDCGIGGPPLTGKTYLQDLHTGIESASIISAVFDSWPHFSVS